MSDIEVFTRQVRSRSAEHRRAMDLLSESGLSGQMISVLRQELDSMVRVIYLLTQDQQRRENLIHASVNGKRWLREGSKKPVTDREMVELARKLHGWARSVYLFGCSFIHLSNLHDYNDRDPFLLVSEQERRSLIDHCRHYHGGPNSNAKSFSALLPYLPKVLEKVSNNLEYYLGELEKGDQMAPFDL
ncbi:hypothetical protein FAP39_13660 [Shimia litoralis]|uniref:Uncharacterized protein n=1 Tax=Shimia litoralis TaxID=420403 RepID=A0A4U7MY50_9RHOB|nr:hypothetical protein [Shimia litoralis]TKZ17998.1 hypothetical protein FAP39_13660 [Shimia litoralis]